MTHVDLRPMQVINRNEDEATYLLIRSTCISTSFTIPPRVNDWVKEGSTSTRLETLNLEFSSKFVVVFRSSSLSKFSLSFVVA